ncbi:24613_t:CDS:2 [Dentiscutata erythropus]|uniref:24613_t:CDS:1 n=1 Tax=Dentiscutata erythropus TaxID=1348616 RepID=A0A9N9H3G1_9GLOM|nr:24613_t:CDS:2 [Dentiscutata erythropus]
MGIILEHEHETINLAKGFYNLYSASNLCLEITPIELFIQ